jgi:hypothetical protein
VERVVLNALAKSMRLCRPDICVFGDLILPSSSEKPTHRGLRAHELASSKRDEFLLALRRAFLVKA